MGEKRKNKRRKSLSRRVIVGVAILTLLSVLGIYSNKNAMEYIAEYAGIYDRYTRLLQLTEETKTAYTEAQMYMSVSFFREGQSDANAILGFVQNQSKLIIENGEALKQEVAKARMIEKNVHDEELDAAITSWADLLIGYGTKATAAAQAGIDGNYMAVYAFGEEQEAIKLQAMDLEKAYDELLTNRVGRIQSLTGTRTFGTNVFNNFLVVVNVLVVGYLVFSLYKNLVKPARASQSKTNDIVKKIQDGNGDLTERVPVQANDEVGSLASGINQMMEELQTIISMMGGHAGSLQQSAKYKF